jgi:hypothetical protein
VAGRGPANNPDGRGSFRSTPNTCGYSHLRNWVLFVCQ